MTAPAATAHYQMMTVVGTRNNLKDNCDRSDAMVKMMKSRAMLTHN
jgi:hypothetical protein